MSDEQRIAAVAAKQPAFATYLGFRLVSAEPDMVVGELPVKEELANRNGMLHGGAIMALADNVGGTATFINLADEFFTVTVESKTNFFRAIRIGETARATCRPLHKGRTTMVWETRITGDDGKLAAIVTQTQLVMTRS